MKKIYAILLVLLCTWSVAEAGRADGVEELRVPDSRSVFRFGAGDRLSIQVYKHEDLDAELLVAPDGTVTLPLLGRIQVAGKSYVDVVDELESGFRAYYSDVSVAVNVVEVSNQKVFVFGEVKNPAVLQITGEMRVLEAIVRTGGISEDARTSNLLLIRGGVDDAQLVSINVRHLMKGDLKQNVELIAGDIVVVPTKTIANIERFFRRIQGLLGPFVTASQIYRNTQIGGNVNVVNDAPPGSQ